jgi:predicted XRE-type DNA-binding protein
MSRISSARRGEVTGEKSYPVVTPELLGLGPALVRGTTSADTSVADRGRWILPLAMKALDRVMARKEASILMGISEPKVSELAQGKDDKTFSLLKLGALGDPFWIAFADEIRSFYKLDDPQARVQQAMDLVSRGMSMLVSEVKR